MVTLERPSHGEISVCGHNLLGGSEVKLAKAELGYVPQEVINHGYFSTREILQFYSGYLGLLNNNKRIDYLLERLALYEHRDKKVKQLSGGMKRRLMIAKALVHSPKVLLLDEPTAGVDIELRSSLWEFVKELRAEGTTVLLTTHYLEEAEELCDRIGVIDHGRLLKLGQTSQLISDMTFRRMLITLKDQPRSIKTESPHLKSIDGKELVLEFSSHLSVGQIIDDIGVDLNNVLDLQLREGSLEDAFIRILDQDGKEV